MSTKAIQEQFNIYIDLLDKIHTLGHEIDASINESEIKDMEERRMQYKIRMKMIRKNLIQMVGNEEKFPVYNELAAQNTLLSVQDGELLYEQS